MLSKKHRATTAQVDKVISFGKTHSSKNFTTRILRNSEPVTAVVVSKKVAKNAIDRNKLKRRIKTALRSLNFPQNTTFVIYAKKESPTLSIVEIQKELQPLLK